MFDIRIFEERCLSYLLTVIKKYEWHHAPRYTNKYYYEQTANGEFVKVFWVSFSWKYLNR